MNDQLLAIGFDAKEAAIYVALIQLGPCSVGDLLKCTQIERRTIYDVLARLTQRGQVSYYQENGTRKYSAIKPEIILQDLEQKSKDFASIIPRLHAMRQTPQDTNVSLLKGQKGLKTVLQEIVQSTMLHCAFGNISPLIQNRVYDRIVQKFLSDLQERGMHEKIIYKKGDAIRRIVGGEYRCIAEELILPTPTILYGDVVLQFVYTEPLTIIKIVSKEISETHKQYFDHFWKLAASE